MAGHGPAPMPRALKVLRGLRVTNKQEPTARGGRPSPPTDLSVAERAAWGETVALLAHVPGLLTRAERGVVELVARTLPPWRDAMRHVREHGGSMTMRDEKGVVRFVQVTPEMTIAIKLGAALKSLYAELGLTPAGRTRIHVPAAPVVDELTKFLAKGAR